MAAKVFLETPDNADWRTAMLLLLSHWLLAQLNVGRDRPRRIKLGFGLDAIERSVLHRVMPRGTLDRVAERAPERAVIITRSPGLLQNPQLERCVGGRLSIALLAVAQALLEVL